MLPPGAAGVLVSASRITTRLLLPDQLRLSTLVFFGCSLLLVAVCCLLHRLSSGSAFVRHHVAACREEGAPDRQPADQLTLVRSAGLQPSTVNNFSALSASIHHNTVFLLEAEAAVSQFYDSGIGFVCNNSCRCHFTSLHFTCPVA